MLVYFIRSYVVYISIKYGLKYQRYSFIYEKVYTHDVFGKKKNNTGCCIIGDKL